MPARRLSEGSVLYVLREPGEAKELATHLHARGPEESQVVAFGIDVERALAELRIPFTSGRAYRAQEPGLLEAEDAMLAAFFADPRWQAWTYRGVDLLATFRFAFRAYLQRVRYFGNLLARALEAHPSAKRIAVFESGGGFIPQVSAVLAPLEVNILADCARVLAAQRGIELAVLPRASAAPASASFLFLTKRALFGALLSAWNALVALIRPASAPRILISDYWRHVAPIMRELPRAECVFLDRAEIRTIGFADLLKHRMRFVHIDSFLTARGRAAAREAARGFIRQWKDMRDSLPRPFSWRGYAFDELLLGAMDAVAAGLEKTLREIEGAYSLYGRIAPELVLLRASVSVQTHFSVLPQVARNLGIPSLELQHGIEYLGPGSWSREHSAEHLAVYGTLVKKELLALGYGKERVHEAGSPRFDRYRPLERDLAKGLAVLCIVPDIRPFEIYDSYCAEDYLQAVASAVAALPNARAIVKLRSGPSGETLLRSVIADAFAGVPHAVRQRESLEELFAESDLVVSGFSTAVLEALACGKPVVMPTGGPIDEQVTRHHFGPYAQAHALRIAPLPALPAALAELSAPQMRESARAAARAFLAEEFRFDGRSASRCASLAAELANKSL